MKYRNSIFILLLIVIPILFSAGCGRGKLEKQATVKITLLHWNDFHAMNVPTRKVVDGDTLLVGGAANLAGYLDHYRVALAPTFSLDAGDAYQGTPISAVTHGRSQVELLNLIKPDAFEVGNHEFDYGVDELVNGMKEAKFPVLLGNVVYEKDGSPLYPLDTVLNVAGVRVGVIGVILDGLKEVTSARATEGLKVLPVIETVRRELARLSPITDIQVCLTHQGVYDDSVLAARIGPDIELIVGGHSHTALREPKVVNGVPIVQAGAKGNYLGIVEMEVDTVSNRITRLQGRLERIIDGKFPPDQAVEELVQRQEASLSEELNRVIATLKTDWVRSYTSESNIGDFIADAYRKAGRADIACANSGGIRRDLQAGEVTIRDIFEVSPFDNELVRFRVTGEELRQIVLYQAKRNSFLQVSGLRYHVKNGKIVSLTVDGAQVKPDKVYTVATVDFVTDHMKRYFNIDPATHPVERLGLMGRDALLTIVEKTGTINSKVEGRGIIE